MNTPSGLRASTKWTQDRLAKQIGISQTDVSDVELGKRSLPGKLVAKWAYLMGVPQSDLDDAIETISDVHQMVSDAEGLANVASKSKEVGEGTDGVVAYLSRFAADPDIPDALRQRAHKTALKLAPMVAKQTGAITLTLASGKTGEFTVQPGSSLDPDLDATGLQGAIDGDGNYYRVDSQSSTAFGPIFGDLVQQAGQPMGSKTASKNKTRTSNKRYEGSGSQRRRMKGNN